MNIAGPIAIVIVALLMSSCQQHQQLQPPAVAAPAKKVASPETALKTASAYLEAKKADLSRHDMSKPEGIQEIQIQGQKAWRVSWRQKDFVGKGGQLVVVVAESGMCETGWGE